MNLVGDWGRASQIFARMSKPEVAKKRLDAEMRDFAEDTLKEVVKFIESQPSDWVPLAPYTVKKKGSATMLIDTGEYLANLKVVNPEQFHYFVGAVSGEPHGSSGLDMATLADYLEFGTRKMPARPHFRPIALRRSREFKRRFSRKKIEEMFFGGAL